MAAAALAGCGSDTARSAWTDGTLAIVGDSMVFEAGGEFDRVARERGWTLTIHAIPGTTFADNLGAIAELAGAAGGDGAVVVELGTNDALTDGDFTPAEAGDIETAVDALTDAGCVLFVNAGLLEPENQEVLSRVPWADYAPGLRAAQALNRHLAAAVTGHDNMHVFDWYGTYNDNPHWTRDFVHVKAEHQADYARVVTDALSDACGTDTTAP